MPGQGRAGLRLSLLGTDSPLSVGLKPKFEMIRSRVIKHHQSPANLQSRDTFVPGFELIHQFRIRAEYDDQYHLDTTDQDTEQAALQ